MTHRTRFPVRASLNTLAAIAALLLALALIATAHADHHQPAATAAQQAVAQEAEVEVADTDVVRYEPVTWNDACIGDRGPEEFCALVLTEGFVFWVLATDTVYRVHTDVPGNEVRVAGTEPGTNPDAFALPQGAEPRDDTPPPPAPPQQPAPPTQPPAPTPTETYTVQSGDTLYRLAQRFNTTVEAIARANRIANVNLIFVGQVLRIPPTEGSDTPPAAGTTYTVQSGDTLFRLSQRFNTTVQNLAQANRIANVNLIFVGQVLVIPGTVTGDTPPSGTPPSGTDIDDSDHPLMQTCTHPAYTVRYPHGWHANTGEVAEACGWFNREPFTVEPATELITDIMIAIEPAPFTDILEGIRTSPFTTIESEAETTVDGLPAVRFEMVNVEDTLLPEGTRSVLYIVDMEGVRDGETLTAVTYSGDNRDLDAISTILDQMMQTISFR